MRIHFCYDLFMSKRMTILLIRIKMINTMNQCEEFISTEKYIDRVVINSHTWFNAILFEIVNEIVLVIGSFDDCVYFS